MKERTNNSIDLLAVAWCLQGIGHFIKHTEPDACPSKAAFYGIGTLVEHYGEVLEQFVNEKGEENQNE
ncbi:MAG: hypothetical protein AB7F43_07690 [Bacteriovoracia bacterium]